MYSVTGSHWLLNELLWLVYVFGIQHLCGVVGAGECHGCWDPPGGTVRDKSFGRGFYCRHACGVYSIVTVLDTLGTLGEPYCAECSHGSLVMWVHCNRGGPGSIPCAFSQ